MKNIQTILLIIACVLFLFGYLRLLTDDRGHIDLNNYRFTGGIGRVIVGLIEGSVHLFSRQLSKEAIAASSIYLGALLFYLSFQL